MKYVSIPRAAALTLALGFACADDERPAESNEAPVVWRACGSGTQAATASSLGPLGTATDADLQAPGARPLDLLFVIDNSRSMAEKQSLLGQVANVLDRFVHPACVDSAGNQFPSPAPGAACADGQRLQFEPVRDVHLGVITTSLGDGGANVACPTEAAFPQFVEDRVDMAHLLDTLPRGAAAGTDGFVRWRAGEDVAAATEQFGNLLAAAGETGCGWEMPLEAWYRFLVDPLPTRASPACDARAAAPVSTASRAPPVKMDGSSSMSRCSRSGGPFCAPILASAS
jgi:hypothetical protein